MLKYKKEDSYVVVGPGRTGSRYIVDIIRLAYNKHRIKLNYCMPTLTSENFESLGTIYHSHNLEIFKIKNLNTKFILSTRNVVDSALSWCVLDNNAWGTNPINKYHLYPKRHTLHNFFIENYKKTIPSFYLDPEVLMSCYNRVKMFYQSITKKELERSIIIKYNETPIFLNTIINKLNFEIPAIYFNMFDGILLPIKNPGTPNQWIKNWNEIEDLILPLESNPENLFNI
ncbi:hypothetical protein CCP3SC1AL1_620018 [Gammaproteobacteria bacterium]